MVAYSFDRRFAPAIVAGLKRQTIRALRKRHARPGERLQLYTGMRSRDCRLLRDDVVCTRLDEITIDLRALADVDDPADAAMLERVARRPALGVVVNGMPVAMAARDAFAARDGFDGWMLEIDQPLSPWAAMVLFWMATHGPGRFDGVIISWETANG